MSQGQGSDFNEIAEQRFKDGLECAKKAIHYDEAKQFGGALSFYDEAVEAFYQACQFDQKYIHILPQVEAYARRAAEIRQAFSNNSIGNEESIRSFEFIYTSAYLIHTCIMMSGYYSVTLGIDSIPSML